MPRKKKEAEPIVEKKTEEAPVETPTQTVVESNKIPKEEWRGTYGFTIQTIEDKIHDVLRKAREEVEYCDDFINMKTGNMRAYESYRAELYEVKYKCRVILESSLLKEHPELVKVPKLPVRPGKF